VEGIPARGGFPTAAAAFGNTQAANTKLSYRGFLSELDILQALDG
jgi:hypothetical protein